MFCEEEEEGGGGEGDALEDGRFRATAREITLAKVVVVVVDVVVEGEEDEEEVMNSSVGEHDAIFVWSTPKHIPVP